MQCARKPFEEKETFRWLQTAEHCGEIKEQCPQTQLVMLADRESDITEVIAYCTTQDKFEWVIRSDGSRVLNKDCKADSSVAVREQLSQTEPLYQQQLSIRNRVQWGSTSLRQRPGKADRNAREVTVSVHAAKVTLNDPRVGKRNGVTMNAVLVRELTPTKNDQPIEWLLLTSLPIRTSKQVALVIDYYSMRWMIELYFKTLKSGCRIESRRFEHIDRFLPSLALYMIVAWRCLYVCRVSRSHSESSCEMLFSEAEWRSVWQIVKRSAPPRRPPRLMEMTRTVAELGGYINRKNSGPPGPQSTWIALQRMHDIVTCWLTFGPGAEKTCV